MPTARAMATSDFSVRVRSEMRLRGSMPGAIRASDARAASVIGRPVDQAPFALEALGHGDVLGDRHPFDQAEILVDEGDRAAAAFEIMQRAVDADLAAIGLHHARQDLHQGGFARAVLAQQGQDLAARQIEIDIAQCLGGAERFRETADRESGMRRGRHRRYRAASTPPNSTFVPRSLSIRWPKSGGDGKYYFIPAKIGSSSRTMGQDDCATPLRLTRSRALG